MAKNPIKGFRRVTILYWSLLFYILAALVWWYISLETQNREMAALKSEEVRLSMDSLQAPQHYQQALQKIESEKKRNTTKYIGEGAIFFLLIVLGAVFVYRSVRRQFRMQQQQQNFMMAVTHELKTPISVARLNLETLHKHNLDHETRTKLIQMTLQETTRLNTLTNNILVASQLEGGGYSISKEELDLSDLFRDCIQEFRNRYPERKLVENIEPEVEISGDALLLQMMINNLLENAIKYSPREKPITCILARQNEKIMLSILDQGAGIPGAEKKKIFDKFYRIGNEATRKTQGTGLGLYLCRIIANDHNADITVTNNAGAGSNFTISFDR